MAQKKAKKPEEITVVAECELTWPGGSERVRSWDTAWHTMKERADEYGRCKSVFIGWARKDDK